MHGTPARIVLLPDVGYFGAYHHQIAIAQWSDVVTDDPVALAAHGQGDLNLGVEVPAGAVIGALDEFAIKRFILTPGYLFEDGLGGHGGRIMTDRGQKTRDTSDARVPCKGCCEARD